MSVVRLFDNVRISWVLEQVSERESEREIYIYRERAREKYIERGTETRREEMELLSLVVMRPLALSYGDNVTILLSKHHFKKIPICYFSIFHFLEILIMYRKKNYKSPGMSSYFHYINWVYRFKLKYPSFFNYPWVFCSSKKSKRAKIIFDSPKKGGRSFKIHPQRR